MNPTCFRAFKPASRVRCNIGFGELAVNLPEALLGSAVPVLLDILRDIPYFDFDRNLAWDGVCSCSRVEWH